MNGDKNMFVLTGSPLYRGPMTKRITENMITKFNDRSDNTHGRKIRFILIDRNFLEGIDLFDVKYLHTVDPYLFTTEETQLIGRGTRTCGQAGLEFRNGWELKVIKYQSVIDGNSIDEQIKNKRLTAMGISSDVVNARDIIDKSLRKNAIDRGLTAPTEVQSRSDKKRAVRLAKKEHMKKKQAEQAARNKKLREKQLKKLKAQKERNRQKRWKEALKKRNAWH